MNSNFGLWFDSHSSTPEALVVESAFLPEEDWCTCHVLSQWFFGRLKLRSADIVREEGNYKITMLLGTINDAVLKPQRIYLFGDALAAVFLRSFIRALDGKTTPVVWRSGPLPALDSRRRF